MLQTFCYGLYIMDVTLQTLWLHDFYYSNSFGRNKCYMQTSFVQIYHIQGYGAFNQTLITITITTTTYITLATLW